MSVHSPCASSFFAVGKPHRPTDAKLTGEEAGRFAPRSLLKFGITGS